MASLFLEAGDQGGASNWSGTELVVAVVVIIIGSYLLCKFVLD